MRGAGGRAGGAGAGAQRAHAHGGAPDERLQRVRASAEWARLGFYSSERSNRWFLDSDWGHEALRCTLLRRKKAHREIDALHQFGFMPWVQKDEKKTSLRGAKGTKMLK